MTDPLLAYPSFCRALAVTESGMQAHAVRFETTLFRRHTHIDVSGHDRHAFDRAFAIAKEAALRSASFGLYQVLGGSFFPVFPALPEALIPVAAVDMFDRRPILASNALLRHWWNESAKRQRAMDAAVLSRNYPVLAHLYNGADIGTEKNAHYAHRLATNWAASP